MVTVVLSIIFRLNQGFFGVYTHNFLNGIQLPEGRVGRNGAVQALLLIGIDAPIGIGIEIGDGEYFR